MIYATRVPSEELVILSSSAMLGVLVHEVGLVRACEHCKSTFEMQTLEYNGPWTFTN